MHSGVRSLFNTGQRCYFTSGLPSFQRRRGLFIFVGIGASLVLCLSALCIDMRHDTVLRTYTKPCVEEYVGRLSSRLPALTFICDKKCAAASTCEVERASLLYKLEISRHLPPNHLSTRTPLFFCFNLHAFNPNQLTPVYAASIILHSA